MMKKHEAKPFFAIIWYTFFLLTVVFIVYWASQSCGVGITSQDMIIALDRYPSSEIDSIRDQLFLRFRAQPFNLISLVIFCLAILHIFLTNQFTKMSQSLRQRNLEKGKEVVDSFSVEILRFLGEVEVVFGIWTIPLLIAMSFYYDWPTAINYLNSRDYTEPMFVVVIMILATTKPIVELSESCLRYIAKIGGESIKAWWWSILTVGPLLGSFITEPAAITLSALLLGIQFYHFRPSPKFAFATLGLLFTNISVGGVLTNFAAPPVLMVSRVWMWDVRFMLVEFGGKAVLGILISNLVYFLIFRKEFSKMEEEKKRIFSKDQEDGFIKQPIPLWISFTHVFFLAWIVVHAHYPVIFIGSFLLFLGFYLATLPFQSDLGLKTPILVGFFLAGLVVHGGMQAWWIAPILSHTTSELLLVLSAILTAFNDNAEITYLASLIPDFSPAMKYSVVAGAVTGGGLTVIANAPNLPGQALLSKYFPKGITVVGLFLGALLPTLIIGSVFFFFRPPS